MVRRRAAALIVGVSVVAACTPTRVSGPLVVTEAWSRPVDSGGTGAVYATIRNSDTTALAIDSLFSPDAGSATLHETMQMAGMVHMSARSSLVIPRDSTVQLKVGGLHVMLTDLRRTLVSGDTVSLTLRLRDGRRVAVRSLVRSTVQTP